MILIIKNILSILYIDRVIKFIINKIKYRKKLIFDYSVIVDTHSVFEGLNKINSKSSFSGKLGLGSYIASNSNIHAEIGRFTSIASNVNIIMGIHSYTYPYVSTSPIFYSLLKQNGETFTKQQICKDFKYADENNKIPVIIGSDCWIGEGAHIIGGITIHDGAIVLAHAVVTKNVPPYAIVGGIPAKILKYRYDEETISFLLQVKWWNKDLNWLRHNFLLFSDMNEFKKKMINIK